MSYLNIKTNFIFQASFLVFKPDEKKLVFIVYIYFFALLKSQIIKPTTKATKKKAQYMPALKMVSTAWQLVSVSNINAKKEKYVYFFITIVFLLLFKIVS